MSVGASPRHAGFTLIELMIVITVIAILAAIAVPNLLSAKSASNESSAISTLRNLNSVQVACANRKFIDIDSDGQGEHGFFGELSAAVPARNVGGGALLPPLLSGVFRTVNAGVVGKSGYLFIIYLPDALGAGLEETPANYANVDPDMAEESWCAYAWPADQGSSGRRAYFVNQTGEILKTNNTQGYSGPGAVPPADAAFANPGTITGPVQPGQAANDGGTWVVN